MENHSHVVNGSVVLLAFPADLWSSVSIYFFFSKMCPEREADRVETILFQIISIIATLLRLRLVNYSSSHTLILNSIKSFDAV